MHLHRMLESSMSIVDMLLLRRLVCDRSEVSFIARNRLDDANMTLRCYGRIITLTEYNRISCTINPFASQLSLDAIPTNMLSNVARDYVVSRIIVNCQDDKKTIRVKTTEGELTLRKINDTRYEGIMDTLDKKFIIVKMNEEVFVVKDIPPPLSSTSRSYLICINHLALKSSRLTYYKDSDEIRGRVLEQHRDQFITLLDEMIERSIKIQ